MPINTIFQLAAHDREELARAQRLVMLPELVAYELTGAAVGERSNAGTTGLLDVATGRLGERSRGRDRRRSADPAATRAGRPSARRARRHARAPRRRARHRLRVRREPAGYRRAAPSSRRARGSSSASSASSRTRRRTRALANFSNEVGALGGFRFLRNVTGFWLLERCASRVGGDGPAICSTLAADRARGAGLRRRRRTVPRPREDGRRGASAPPGSAPTHRRRSSRDRSSSRSRPRWLACWTSYDASRCRSTSLPSSAAALGRRFVLERIAHHAGVPVVPGATEATALGNALLQGIALGRFDDLAEGRIWVRGQSSAAA